MERVAEKGSHRAGEGEMDRSDRDFDQLLGAAVAKCWGELPQGIQQRIYEHAVGAGCADDDPLFREQLAVYLHNHHPRTERQTAMPQEPSAASSGLSLEVETELNSRSWEEDRAARRRPGDS